MGVESSPSPRSTTRAARSKRAASAPTTAATPIDQDLRRALIAKAAFYRAERRGFAGGCETDDWLAAEVEVDTTLTLGAVTSSS